MDDWLSVRAIFRSGLAFFAEVQGTPVAFILALPDMNQPLHRAYARPGKPEPITLLQVLWHWKLRSKINRIRIMLMGVQEGYRGIGVEAAMFAEMYQAAARMGWHYAMAAGCWRRTPRWSGGRAHTAPLHNAIALPARLTPAPNTQA